MRFPFSCLFLATGLIAISGHSKAAAYDPFAPAPDPPVCSLDYVLPGDIGPPIPTDATDGDFMQFAWRTFLALNAPEPDGQISLDGDNVPQWSKWSSTSDLLNAKEPQPSGARYYPPSCRAIQDHENYRVIQQVGKVDDSFLQASDGTLSADPLLDRNGNFLRFEIMLSPAVYDQVVAEQLYDRRRLNARITNVNLICGEATYTGGNPSDSRLGAIVLKAAWMDADDFTEAEKAGYHTETVLVFTPEYRNATGSPTCEIEDLALVGLHVARKTEQQPNWTWATWEHVDNAPDCTAQMPNGQGGPVNTTCPESPAQNYNFFSESCQDESTEGACQVCNTVPENNTTQKNTCENPFDFGTCSDDPDISCTANQDCKTENAGTCVYEGWCLDLPPAEVAGKSRICRQVPVDKGVCSDDPAILCTADTDCSMAGAGVCTPNYPSSNEWNTACWEAIDAAGSGTSAWRNYRLLGIQWVAEAFSECKNVQKVVFPLGGPVNYSIERQLVHTAGDGTRGDAYRPVLANTSMESYERSNCTGCHSKTGLQGVCSSDPNQTCTIDFECPEGGVCDQITTDFMYWLKLEVGDPPAILSKGRRFRFNEKVDTSTIKNRLRMRYSDRVTYVPNELSSDDPRCLADPEGTVKARIRFFNNAQSVDSYDLDLPCENWKKIRNGGYAYRSKTGACRRVLIGLGKRISASCSNVEFLQDFVPAGASLYSVLSLNQVRYCATFDDFVEKTRNRYNRFRSRTGSLEGQCPVPVRFIGLGADKMGALPK